MSHVSLSGQDDVKQPVDAAGIEFFETKIPTVLVKHCYECHSAEANNVKGGVLLDSREAAGKGGDSGAAFTPKNVDESHLFGALRYDSFEILPNGKLPDAVIADFVKWVEMGAPDPRDGEVVANAIDFDEAHDRVPRGRRKAETRSR